MVNPTCCYTDEDRRFFDRELAGFVPDCVFDAHLHLGPRAGYAPAHRDLVANTPEVIDRPTYQRDIERFLPARTRVGAVAITNALDGSDIDNANAFVHDANPLGWAMLVGPNAATRDILDAIARDRPAALKCYHLLADRDDTMNADLVEYLPPTLAAAAHEANLPVIVHLVKPCGLADPANQRDIHTLSRTFPNMTMILAHAARGFNPSHVESGISAVAELDNVHFGLSTAGESAAFEAILRAAGYRRVVYGSDYPFSHLHGRCVAVNDSFIWLFDDRIDAKSLSPDRDLRFTLVGYESLRALKQACHARSLGDADIEAIFADNAINLFGAATLNGR